MAVLMRRLDPGRLLVVTALMGLAGCFLLDPYPRVSEEDLGPAFNHEVHVTGNGLQCVVCHRNDPEVSGDLPGQPSPELCQTCHRRFNDDQPPERRVETLIVDGQLLMNHRTRLGDGIEFNHRDHLFWVEDCNACHGDVASKRRFTTADAFSMDDCTSCHEERGLDTSCKACHPDIGTDWMPGSHGMAWEQIHGGTFRNPSDALGDQCSLCHTESTCTQCHREETPRDHTSFFRLRSHGYDAAFDRTRCDTCHRDDFCARCHEGTRPLSHVGMFGNTRNTHCVTCHEPLKNNGCFVCHKSTPSHAQATPLPGGHNISWNCRQCHGNGAPLPHIDNGSSCVSCHRY